MRRAAEKDGVGGALALPSSTAPLVPSQLRARPRRPFR